MAGRKPVVGVSNGLAAPQHPGDAQVLVEFGPVNAHRHQLEAPARRGTGIPQPRIPRQRGRDPATIRQRYHEFVRGKGNRDRPDIADINLQAYPSTNSSRR